MKTRISLLLLYLLSALCSLSLAESLDSLDVIVKLTDDFRNYHKRVQQQQPQPIRVITVKK